MGVSFEDAIGYGSYCVDIHHEDRAGITFRYLDGTELIFEDDMESRKGRWREETSVNPTFYQIPYRTMVQDNIVILLFVVVQLIPMSEHSVLSV